MSKKYNRNEVHLTCYCENKTDDCKKVAKIIEAGLKNLNLKGYSGIFLEIKSCKKHNPPEVDFGD